MRAERSFCTLKKKILIVLIVVFAILSGLWYAFFYREDNEEAEKSSEVQVSPTCASEPSPTAIPKKYIIVHMCGSVRSPGVVRIEEGSRLTDAVTAAGGFDDEADRNYLNLARILSDGERIYVPSEDETAVLSVKETIKGGDTGGSEEDGTKENEVININTADIRRLTELPGIGESRAKDIIAYRNKAGAFEKKEDIKNVSGIGESLYARIADLITVE